MPKKKGNIMQDSQMQEIGLIKVLIFLPKIVVAVAGALLALVLSGDIDKDGKLNISLSLLIKISSAVCISIFGGAFVIETYHLTGLSAEAKLFIGFMMAVFGLMIIGILYQSLALMKGKPLGDVIGEIMGAFISIFSKSKSSESEG
jgi:hypothetical protein